ncbi:MAG: hypothetical protein AAGC74_05425 [Verrucomicrobiota bacterium]
MARTAALATFLLGFLLLAVALKSPWFVLPTSVDQTGELITRDVAVTRTFRLGLFIALVVLVLLLAVQCFRRGWQDMLSGSFLWAIGILPLLWWYPQWVIVQDANTSGDAAWLQQQHDNLTWLGGDVFRAHSERYNEAQLQVNMQDPPLLLAAFRAPMDKLTTLGIEEIPEVIWWFGLNPAFSQFAGTGWFAAWLGVGAIALGSFGWLKHLSGKVRRILLKRGFIVLILSCTLVACAGLLPVLKASSALRASKNAALQGQYNACLSQLEIAKRWMPSLAFDSTVILQQGRMETLLALKTSTADLYRVWKLENEGYGSRAKELLYELELRRTIMPRSLQRELSRSWMRVTIDDFNSGRLSEAKSQFQHLCDVEPAAIQARFHLQLTALQTADIETNRRCAHEIKELYAPFLRKNKRGVISTSNLILSQGELVSGNPLLAAEARRESKGL